RDFNNLRWTLARKEADRSVTFEIGALNVRHISGITLRAHDLLKVVSGDPGLSHPLLIDLSVLDQEIRVALDHWADPVDGRCQMCQKSVESDEHEPGNPGRQEWRASRHCAAQDGTDRDRNDD